jgi:hypothetical protein
MVCAMLLAVAPVRANEPMESWQEVEAPGDQAVQAIAVTGTGSVIAGTLEAGLFRSDDDARTWTNVGPADARILSVLTLPCGDLLAGTFGDGLLRSSDQGRTWHPDNTGLTDAEITSLAASPAGVLYAGTSRSGVFRRAPGENRWQQIGLDGSFITTLGVSRFGSVVAGTAGEGVAVSKDGGATWTHTGGVLMGRAVWAVAVDCEDALYAAVGGLGVLRSRDDGRSWSQLNAGLGDMNVGALACTEGRGLLAGTAAGVYRLAAGEEGWQSTDGGSENAAIRCVAFGARSSFLAGTVFGKMFTVASADVGGR